MHIVIELVTSLKQPHITRELVTSLKQADIANELVTSRKQPDIAKDLDICITQISRSMSYMNFDQLILTFISW